MAAIIVIAAVLGAAILLFAALCVQVRVLAHKKYEMRPCDCVIVLGARVWQDGRMSHTLLYRCERALALLRADDKLPVILSGGRGADEPCSEAEAMRGFFLENGVADHRLLMETQSGNTVENLAFSRKIMADRGFSSAMIVTSDYHAARALRIAEDMGIRGCAVAAPSPKRVKTKIKTTLQESVSRMKYALLRRKNAPKG